MTPDPGTRKDTYLFSVAEPICILIDFHALPPGRHYIETDWIAPSGSVEQHDSYGFTAGREAPFHYFSCLRILRNGPFKQLFTGTDRDSRFTGAWNVHVYIDNERIEDCLFEVH